MDYRSKIQVDLIKLVSGDRLMRLTYPPSGLVLERKLDAERAVVPQKERLLRLFEATLKMADLTPGRVR